MTDPNFPTDPRNGQPPAPPSFASTPPAAPPGFSAPPPPPAAAPAPPAAAPAPPAAVPPAPPAPFGEASFLNDTTTIEDRIEKKPSMVGRVGLVAAALAVAGGGAFAVSRALSEPAGAQTPEEAVDQLFEAVENDDLVGLTEVMLPSERESLVEPMIDLFAEFERLELLDEDFDFEGRSGQSEGDGLDFSVSGLAYTTTPIGDGVVNAELTSGIVTVTGEVNDLPFGDRATAELDAETLAESVDEEIADFSQEDDARFTLVEEDGSWYVSLWYTVAEAAREEAGEPVPAFGQGVAPTGSASPEAAVQLMMDEVVDLDAEGVIATLDPSEFRALHDYAPLFLDDADRAANELRQLAADEGVTWSLDRLDLSSSDVRGRTVVSVSGFAFSVAGNDDAASVDFDGQCFTVIEGQQIDQICLDEITSEMDELPQAYTDFLNEYTTGITVVERDSGWYISGMPTIIGAYTDLLAALDQGDIEDFGRFFEDSVESAFDLADPFGDPFSSSGTVSGEADPFFEDFPAEEEEGYDPFAEDEPVEDPFDEVPVELTPEMIETFVPGLEINAADASQAYFAGEVGIRANWYGYAYSPDTGDGVEIVAFDVSADELIAGLDASAFYQRVDVDGLPDGAVAFDWPDIDRAVVIDNYIVSAYFDADGEAPALLMEQINAIAAAR